MYTQKAAVYVAFLRGINVGGNNIIKMEKLREAFEQMGYTQVRTYIQSGNVIFHTPTQDKKMIERHIEDSLKKIFHMTLKVLVRSQDDIEQTIAHFPPLFADQTWKHNVIYLRGSLDTEEILKRFDLKKDIEHLAYYPGVLYWSAQMANLTKSTMLKLSTRAEYKDMTVRNMNTTKKILLLMQA